MYPSLQEIESYLHEHIPVTAAMGISVLEVSEASLRLAAPLAPNINHRQSLFGGSGAAIAMVAAWAYLHARLCALDLSPRLVIHRHSMNFDSPIVADFEAIAPAPPTEAWRKFETMLRRRGKARLTLTSTLACGGQLAATFSGEYVAVDQPN